MRNLLLFAIIIASTVLYSQTESYFKFQEQVNNKYETVFTIIGIENTEISTKISKELESTKGVEVCKIFYNRRCKIISEEVLYVQRIHNILQKFDADVDISYCKINEKLLYTELKSAKLSSKKVKLNHIPVSEWIFPDDYPKEKDIKGKLEYKLAIKNWIENNPERWKEFTGREYLDYSILVE